MNQLILLSGLIVKVISLSIPWTSVFFTPVYAYSSDCYLFWSLGELKSLPEQIVDMLVIAF